VIHTIHKTRQPQSWALMRSCCAGRRDSANSTTTVLTQMGGAFTADFTYSAPGTYTASASFLGSPTTATSGPGAGGVPGAYLLPCALGATRARRTRRERDTTGVPEFQKRDLSTFLGSWAIEKLTSGSLTPVPADGSGPCAYWPLCDLRRGCARPQQA